jgi:PAS domain S-box-containing protein
VFIHFPDGVQERFPQDNDLKELEVVSYMGVPLQDVDGRVLGHIAVMDSRPMPAEPRGLALIRIFAARAAAEMTRLRAEADVRQREAKLGRLLASAMDAVIELDHDQRVTMLNPAGEKILGVAAGDAVGSDFGAFVTAGSREKLVRLIDELDGRPEGQRYLWIPGGLQAVAAGGEAFAAEATLSRSELGRQTFYLLILRNVNERLKAEEKIRSLTIEGQYLREELRELHNFDQIIGCSDPIRRVLRDVEQVAATDASVLLLGETGTGKELFARAIHAASARREKPLIKVNCAAIPESLMESEFFGHEKGAFTGATQKREGRFALADGGTIFLDEVGELPLDLQSKLLRVLQEGEFEPVGSSRTQTVDVRVVTASNRDLDELVRDGRFREDLFYRLNVFPIRLPPLRERGDDIVVLARSLAERYARKMGRAVEPLSEQDIRRLKAYAWPGNVRELENVIERALITSPDGRLNLDRALPETAPGGRAESSGEAPQTPSPLRTARELQELERDNLVRALERCGWRVSGEQGAARLLGMPPSTLASRMKALGIQRSPNA